MGLATEQDSIGQHFQITTALLVTLNSSVIPTKMKVKLFRLKATCGGFTVTHPYVFRRFYATDGNEECTALSDTQGGTIEACNFCQTLDCPGISKTVEKVYV